MDTQTTVGVESRIDEKPVIWCELTTRSGAVYRFETAKYRETEAEAIKLALWEMGQDMIASGLIAPPEHWKTSPHLCVFCDKPGAEAQGLVYAHPACFDQHNAARDAEQTPTVNP